MDVFYETKRMQKDCGSEKAMRRRWGARTAQRLQQRLAELEAAPNLAAIRGMPAPRCHELTGDRKGRLAVDLIQPFRLIFRPADDPPPSKPDGGLDWFAVTGVVILEVTDYH